MNPEIVAAIINSLVALLPRIMDEVKRLSSEKEQENTEGLLEIMRSSLEMSDDLAALLEKYQDILVEFSETQKYLNDLNVEPGKLKSRVAVLRQRMSHSVAERNRFYDVLTDVFDIVGETITIADDEPGSTAES